MYLVIAVTKKKITLSHCLYQVANETIVVLIKGTDFMCIYFLKLNP